MNHCFACKDQRWLRDHLSRDRDDHLSGAQLVLIVMAFVFLFLDVFAFGFNAAVWSPSVFLCILLIEALLGLWVWHIYDKKKEFYAQISGGLFADCALIDGQLHIHTEPIYGAGGYVVRFGVLGLYREQRLIRQGTAGDEWTRVWMNKECQFVAKNQFGDRITEKDLRDLLWVINTYKSIAHFIQVSQWTIEQRDKLVETVIRHMQTIDLEQEERESIRWRKHYKALTDKITVIAVHRPNLCPLLNEWSGERIKQDEQRNRAAVS